MWRDVVKQVFQVTDVSDDYKLENGNPFYVYILPLNNESPSEIIIKGKPSYNNQTVNMPITASVWNPILINSMNIGQDVLDKFYVFVGLNYVSL